MTRPFHPEGWLRRPLTRRLAVAGSALTVAFGGPTAHVLSSALAAPVWSISGVVQLPDGTPVSNAWVGLSIMPAGALPTTPTPTVYVAQTVTGTDGSYTIPAPTLSTDALTQAANNNGWLNFELDASSIDATPTIGTANANVMQLGSTAFSVLVGPSTIAAPTIGTILGAPNPGLLVVYEAPDDAKAVVDSLGIGDPLTCVRNGQNCPSLAAQPAYDNQCGTNWHSINSGNFNEPVGEAHTWDDMSGSFKYSKTSSTNLGVSFNYGSGWSVSGSAYMGNTSSYSVGTLNFGADYAYQALAQFAWEEDESNPPCTSKISYRIRPLWFTGGGIYQGPNVSGNDGPSKYYSVADQYHADIQAGQDVDVESGQGYKYSWQASAFGVTVGSETDYSTNVQMHWKMGTTGVTHSLFGYGAPPSSPNVQIIFASTE
jgi:hypothetical protein